MKVYANEVLCTTCRTCQLVCSFHHVKRFQPDKASISIHRDNRTGSISWAVDETCDLCRNEKASLCISNCPFGALRME